MSWIEQQDVTKMVRWGALKPDDNPTNLHLVKKGEELIGTIKDLVMRDFENSDGDIIKKPSITMELDGGGEVRFIAPGRLQTSLGLNPNWKKTKVAQVGDKIKIVYLGIFKEGKGKPHLFEVYWDE